MRTSADREAAIEDVQVKGEPVALDQVMNDIGLGLYHYRLVVICGIGFAAAAIEVVLTGFIFPELEKQWRMDEYALGLLPTIVGFGSIIGEITWGHVADRYGRRPIFMGTLLLVIAFGVASAFSGGYRTLYVLRFFVGLGYGGNIAVDFVLFSEFLPTYGRGTMLYVMAAFWPVGMVTATVLAWLVIPTWGWRVYLIFCAVPSIATFFLRPLIPETPRFLLLNGQDDEALEVCRSIAIFNGKQPEDVGLGPGTRLSLENETAALNRDKQDKSDGVRVGGCWIGAMRLFGRGLWRTTVANLFVVASLGWAGYITTTLMPDFLQSKGLDKMAVYPSMLMSSLCQFPGVALAWYLSMTFGRISQIPVSLICVAVSLFLFILSSNDAVTTLWLCLANTSLEFAWALYHTYTAEVYPTELRATAMGFITALGSCFSMAVPMLSAWILHTRGYICVLIVVVGISVFTSAVSRLLYNIETLDRDLSDKAEQLWK